MASDADTTPAVTAPAGWTTDLSHPVDLYDYTVVTTIVSLVITVPLVAARIFTRVRFQPGIKLEDWLLIAAEIAFIAWLAILLILPGRGAHEWNVSLSTANSFAFLVNILELVYVFPLLLSKTALLLQLKRIFTADSTIRNAVYWSLQLLIFTNLVAYVAIIIWAIVFITRQNQDFDPNCTGECHNSNYVLVATGIFNAVIDLLTLGVPLYAVRGLHMSLRKKLGVAAVFGVGGLACAASVLRAVTSFEPINNERDQTYTTFPLLYWAAAEIAAVISATSIPALPKLWREIGKWHKRRAGDGSAVNYPMHSNRRRREKGPDTYALGTLNDIEVGTRSRVAQRDDDNDPEDLAADGDVRLIQGRMRGLGLYGSSRQPERVEDRYPPMPIVAPPPVPPPPVPPPAPERSRRSSRSSMESGLREMPVLGHAGTTTTTGERSRRDS